MSIKKHTTDMTANNLTPAFPSHPGSILKDEIEFRGISQCQLAKDMGIAYSALNEILNERRPLTEKTALLFEAALGINAEPLMKLQMSYNMQTARQDATFMRKLSRVKRIEMTV
jgi:antitoxin HigA-1